MRGVGENGATQTIKWLDEPGSERTTSELSRLVKSNVARTDHYWNHPLVLVDEADLTKLKMDPTKVTSTPSVRTSPPSTLSGFVWKQVFIPTKWLEDKKSKFYTNVVKPTLDVNLIMVRQYSLESLPSTDEGCELQ